MQVCVRSLEALEAASKWMSKTNRILTGSKKLFQTLYQKHIHVQRFDRTHLFLDVGSRTRQFLGIFN